MIHRADAPNRLVRLAGTLAGLLLALAALGDRARGDILYQTGFEPPTFTTGALVGQGSFSELYGQSQQAAVVTTTAPASGSQAVSIDGGLLDDAAFPGFYTGLYSPLLRGNRFVDPLGMGLPTVTVQASFQLIGSPTADDDVSVNLEASGPSTFNYGAMWLSSDGHLWLFGADGANSFEQSVTYSQSSYNTLAMTLNFSNQEISYFFNGTFLGQKGFAADPSDATVGVDFAMEGVFQPTGYTARVDDFSVRAVPEPSSFVLCLIGVAGATLGVSRRRRTAILR